MGPRVGGQKGLIDQRFDGTAKGFPSSEDGPKGRAALQWAADGGWPMVD